MASNPIPLTDCAQGRHRARRVPVKGDILCIRSVCRDCGCDLVRTQATRRWIYSGPLGATA